MKKKEEKVSESVHIIIKKKKEEEPTEKLQPQPAEPQEKKQEIDKIHKIEKKEEKYEEKHERWKFKKERKKEFKYERKFEKKFGEEKDKFRKAKFKPEEITKESKIKEKEFVEKREEEPRIEKGIVEKKAENIKQKLKEDEKIQIKKEIAPEIEEEKLEKEEETEEQLQKKVADEIEVFGGAEFIIPFRPKYTFRKKRKFWKKEREEQKQTIPQETGPKKIKIPEFIRIADLSKITGIKASEIISKLISYGKEVTINHTISADDAELVLAEFGIEVEREEFDESLYLDLSPDPEDKLKPRPPVVVVMGHVDHGKTTLLDAIRKTKVAEQEIGGITQSIGAYTVELEKGVITFIDTPGHEAFTEMRARGAKVADIAVLVVAADEGVKPQTEEAISHAKAAGVPIVVAINKIDKQGANPHLVKNQLAQLGLTPDDWGGDTLFAEISAKKRIGIDDLLEKILIQAELLNLKANPYRPAEGVIIESSIDKGLGNIATVIVQRGTLRKGDVFVAGHTFGRVRNIFSDKGKIIKELLPGFPGRIVISSEEIPLAGDKLYVVKDEETAKKIVEERKKREVKRGSIALEEIYDKLMQSEDKIILPLILKANSKGALDALEKEIAEIKVPQLEIRIIHKGIGIISQSDINLASASKGIVIGYSVGIEKQAQNLAKMQGVQVRLYKIIYEIVDDIKKAVKGMLKPKEKEIIVGTARILKIFKLSVGKVLGCVIEKGKVQLGLNARIKRNGDIISEGKIISLKKFKDSVDEVKEGEECGILIEGLQDAMEQDLLECYNIVKEEIKIE
jgi:translation initiation factor IF-2